ncbi:MAG: universal stress protein [Sedimentisphaerales bacterium]|nr:universal stress protein [Sedimentisphaerales bacterium]
MEYKRILHALDGSEGSFKALGHAIELARRFHAELHSISVEEVPHYPGTVGEVVESRQAANGTYGLAMERAKQMAREQNTELHCHVLVGHEIKTIVEFVKERGFDLLVIGFMGHSKLYDRVMGSTCQGLVRLAGCSVLVVK